MGKHNFKIGDTICTPHISKAVVLNNTEEKFNKGFIEVVIAEYTPNDFIGTSRYILKSQCTRVPRAQQLSKEEVAKLFVRHYNQNLSIDISTDGYHTTTATLVYGYDAICKCVSRCSPTDEFDFGTGVEIAVQRLLHEAFDKMPPPEDWEFDMDDFEDECDEDDAILGDCSVALDVALLDERLTMVENRLNLISKNCPYFT